MGQVAELSDAEATFSAQSAAPPTGYWTWISRMELQNTAYINCSKASTKNM